MSHITSCNQYCSAMQLMQMVVKAQVPNYLVVAIDTQLRDDLLAKGYNVYYRDITVCY